MQHTRQLILDHLKEHGPATADDLAAGLNPTTATARPHLDILRREAWVAEPAIRRRASPGRPQYAYAFTAQAASRFPNNYGELAAKLIEEIKTDPASDNINVIFEGVAARVAAEAPCPSPGEQMKIGRAS